MHNIHPLGSFCWPFPSRLFEEASKALHDGLYSRINSKIIPLCSRNAVATEIGEAIFFSVCLLWRSKSDIYGVLPCCSSTRYKWRVASCMVTSKMSKLRYWPWMRGEPMTQQIRYCRWGILLMIWCAEYRSINFLCCRITVTHYWWLLVGWLYPSD